MKIAGSGFPGASRPDTSASSTSRSERPSGKRDGCQQPTGVARGRGGRDRESQLAEADQERDGVVEHRRGLAFDEVDESTLLGFGVRVHVLVVGVGHADGLEPSAGPVEARSPGHGALVALRRERAGLVPGVEGELRPGAGHEPVEGLAPCLLVRRVDEYAVHVEDGCAKGDMAGHVETVGDRPQRRGTTSLVTIR